MWWIKNRTNPLNELTTKLIEIENPMPNIMMILMMMMIMILMMMMIFMMMILLMMIILMLMIIMMIMIIMMLMILKLMMILMMMILVMMILMMMIPCFKGPPSLMPSVLPLESVTHRCVIKELCPFRVREAHPDSRHCNYCSNRRINIRKECNIET